MLVPDVSPTLAYELPIELLEPAACGAACAVVDREGLSSLFRAGEEVLVPASGDDLVPYLTTYGDNRLVQIGHRAAKRARAARDHHMPAVKRHRLASSD